MEYPLAVVTCDPDKFHYDILETDIKFKTVSSIDDTRGMVFSGYIMLWDAPKLKDLSLIIYWIKSRIKN